MDAVGVVVRDDMAKPARTPWSPHAPYTSDACSGRSRASLTACRREILVSLPLAARKPKLVSLTAERPYSLAGMHSSDRLATALTVSIPATHGSLTKNRLGRHLRRSIRDGNVRLFRPETRIRGGRLNTIWEILNYGQSTN